MIDSGVRLKEERERLGMTQTAFAERTGVQKNTQLNYEKGARSPDVSYLSRAAAAGADVQYIVTGQRAAASLTSDVQHLVSAYLAAPAGLRAAALAVLGSGDATAPKKAARLGPSISIGGDVGQVVKGDATFNAPVVGKKARKK